MKQYLLPVWGDSRFGAAAKDFGLQKGEWFDQAPMNYGHCLISYVHWKRPFVFPKGCYIFGDSGGFSLRSESKKHVIDPVDVLRWQSSMCTVGCVLDLPPTGSKGNRVWHKGLQTTLDHTERTLPEYKRLLQEGSSFRWWGVLHGNNEEEVRTYYESLAAIYPFDGPGEGWAIRPEPQVDIDGVARSLRILQKLGIKRAHFLAATSQDVIAVLLALGPVAGLELVTYDSAYAMKCGFNRHFFFPNEDEITFRVVAEEGDEVHARDVLLTCTCGACEHMRPRASWVEKALRETASGKFGGWWSTRVQFHNMYVQQSLTAAQARVAEKDPHRLLKLLLNDQDYSRVLRIFEEDGHEKRLVPTGSSNSLLDFI